MKILFRTLAILSGLFAGFDLLAAGTAYMRDPATIPGLWLVAAIISLFWAGLFAAISRRFK